jgi:hypothetical protein
VWQDGLAHLLDGGAQSMGVAMKFKAAVAALILVVVVGFAALIATDHLSNERQGLHNASEANRAGLVNPAVSEPVIFIVSYHNLDYAKEACEFMLAGASEAREKIRALAKIDLRPFDWVYDVVNADDECKSVPDPRELGRRLGTLIRSNNDRLPLP